MLKNRFLSVFAIAAMVGFAACEAEPEAEVVEEPVVEEPVVAPVVEPAPVPMTTDTMMMPADTAM